MKIIFSTVEIVRKDFMDNCFDNKSNEELLSIYNKTQNIEIMTKLLYKNKNMIHHVINKYFSHTDKVTKEDLYQEGMIALYNCINQYDISKNTMFSTYIYQSIYHNLINYSKHNYLISIPENKITIVQKYNKYVSDYIITNNKSPTDEEIKAYLLITDADLIKIKECAKLIDTVSYDELISLPSQDDMDIEEYINNIFIHNKILEILKKVLKNDNEYNVITSYYGLIDNKPLNIREISDKYKLSINQVQYIKTTTLNRLKKSKTLKKLNNFI